ncbi:hypothetical protein [Roseimicrobium sp. ORNL1]|uniref:hypothetical protein n=1 Tax=Roseimicrobium sp. ORNL1 TaxID=2711231 RepID=UPI0013E13800|nr:hypothetical protein [Roseimicrobium sp. ORNL1]QIE99997.1 hypothetical protein G5S37_00140 [Roseimicrobium sp. ORNL1]
MNSPSSLFEVLETAFRMLGGSLPMLLAYAAGLIIVITRWRVAPRVSMLALCGVLLGLFLVLAMPFVYTYLSRSLSSGSGGSSMNISIVYTVVGFANSFAHALSFGFLLLAIYKDRRSPMAPPPSSGY